MRFAAALLFVVHHAAGTGASVGLGGGGTATAAAVAPAGRPLAPPARQAIDGRALVARDRPWFTPFLPDAAVYLRALEHRGDSTRSELVIGVSLIWTLDPTPVSGGGR